MKKENIVKDNKYFNEVIQNNNFIKNKYYVIYIMKKESVKPKFGVAVGKKIGNAVIRNKIKRRIRNIITTNISLFPTYNDYIIVAKRFCKDEKYDKLNVEMQKLLRKGE